MTNEELRRHARAAARLLQDAPDDDVTLAKVERIRCRTCGFECDTFKGWAFAAGRCRGITEPDGRGGVMLHEWEPVTP